MKQYTEQQIAEWNERAALDAKKREDAKARAMAKSLDSALGNTGAPERAVEVVKSGALKDTPARIALMAAEFDLLVLSGGPGSGKTIAATEWLNSWVGDAANWTCTEWAETRLNAQCLFIKAAQMARWERYNDEQMNKLIKAHRLVIDDLGVEYMDKNGCYLSLLDEVIDARYDRRRATVITTNLDTDEFKARYGERIADRIRECGRFATVGSDSLRRRVKPVRLLDAATTTALTRKERTCDGPGCLTRMAETQRT